jgi:hypothetical protein
MLEEPTVLVKWSYSSLSLFQQCPKKYYHLRVEKSIKEPQSEQMRYGLDLHKAAEEYIRDGIALPEGFAFMRETLDQLKALPGEKYCEYKLGLTRDLEPCEFFDDNVWWRGIADLLVINGDEARVLDYKTGKDKYADTKQLEILALAVFKKFPQVQRVRAGLLFVIHTNFIKAAYERTKEMEMWNKWLPETNKLETAYEKNVWNAKQNFTCKAWCPVMSCPHNGKR